MEPNPGVPSRIALVGTLVWVVVLIPATAVLSGGSAASWASLLVIAGYFAWMRWAVPDTLDGFIGVAIACWFVGITVGIYDFGRVDWNAWVALGFFVLTLMALVIHARRIGWTATKRVIGQRPVLIGLLAFTFLWIASGNSETALH
jgi:hypothetical protein